MTPDLRKVGWARLHSINTIVSARWICSAWGTGDHAGEAYGRRAAGVDRVDAGVIRGVCGEAGRGLGAALGASGELAGADAFMGVLAQLPIRISFQMKINDYMSESTKKQVFGTLPGYRR